MRLHVLAALTTSLALSGCASFLRSHYSDTVPPEEGTEVVRGLRAPVTVSRDDLGIPLIEAADDQDLVFAMGFVAAQDRLSQMVGMRAMAQGRLAEHFGRELLDIDVYLRTLDLTRIGRAIHDAAPAATRRMLARYAEGVNAYLASHPLPPDLQFTGMVPDPWRPEDSMTLFAVLNLGLAFNVHEELDFLRLAQKVGLEKAAWLVPVYPDEPLPFAEAQKLAGVDLSGTRDALDSLAALQPALRALRQRPLAASNDWVVHKSRTRDGASILADDTHVPLAMPSYWHFVHARSPTFHAAGVALAGIPVVVAGYNGKVAWGMTMVMADGQDVFLEELKTEGGKLLYRKGEAWLPATERTEVFAIKGGAPVTRVLYETRHGPLLNPALQSSKYPLITPQPLRSAYGLALAWNMRAPDTTTADAFLRIARATSVDEIEPLARALRSIPLNFVYADADNIAWQVTGQYPVRRAGRGMLPSPGWVEDYDWTGYLAPADHPFKKNPPEGFIGTANHRSVPADFPHVLSSSWFYPERSERIQELLGADRAHTREASQAMQRDQHTRFAAKLAAVLRQLPMEAALSALPPERAVRGREALGRLLAFDGSLRADSGDAAVYGAFLHRAAIRIFGDELGYPADPAWRAFVDVCDQSYSAIPDHLLQREDSPYWDDVGTPTVETKPQVLAAALADAIELLEERLGPDRKGWQWGRLHTYLFEPDTGKLARELGGAASLGFGLVEGFFNRGPFPAGGDQTTLNSAGYQTGDNFDAWLVPAMRLVVDFSREEPMVGVNSSGQSGNPASAHYDDGIHTWLEGRYQPFPFAPERMAEHYRARRVLTPR